MFKNYSLRYGFYGLLLGLSLPLLVYFLNNNIGYSGTFSYKNINPLLIFFIVSFHLLFTLILFLIGKKYQKIIDSNNKLKIINQENIEFQQDNKSLNTGNLFAFIEGNNDSIWSFDQDYKLLMFNSKFKKSYKLVFEKDPEIGVDLKDFLYVPQYRVWANLFKRALDGEKLIEEVNLSINGKDIYTELTFNPVVVKDKVVSVTTHSRNISQQKKIELSLKSEKEKAQEANLAKSDFLATMSHEIRTPMNGVIGMTSLLLQTQLNDEQKDYVETIKLSGESLLTIINDILDFSKIDSGKMELEKIIFNLKNTIEDIFDLLSIKALEKQIELIYKIDLDVPELLIGDVTRVRQILINLISNAIKFTSKGEVYVYVKKNSSIYRETILEFSIKDTGIGISEDKIEKLFKPFSQADSSTTRKYGGTGLGLAISKNLIELHNGKIWVESEVDKGSSFYFTIQTDKPDIKTNNKNIEKIAQLKDKNVLIIDENLTNIDTITYILQNWQMNVTSTNHNISKIMNLIKENNFSVIIMNINNIDLNEANISEIRKYKDDEELPIVTLTFINDLQAKNQKHVYTYIQKPIKQEQMMKSLVNAIYNNKESKIKIKDKKIIDKLSDKFDLEILIAEDNIINQKLALKIFSKLGYEADLVNNGLEAIEAVKNKRYDLIFMDLQMPEMDGIEATKYIIANYSNRPKIIALTANAMPEDQDMCFAAGMDDYLSKPVSIDIIKNVLIKWSEIIYS